MLLYHGTSAENAISILKNGFDFTRSGCCWGNTYGKGIYFSPNYKTAKFYAGENGVVLSFQINIEAFFMTRDISPSSKKKLKIDESKYNCIVNPNKDEYLILYFI